MDVVGDASADSDGWMDVVPDASADGAGLIGVVAYCLASFLVGQRGQSGLCRRQTADASTSWARQGRHGVICPLGLRQSLVPTKAVC
jgi:hypothetical protein